MGDSCSIGLCDSCTFDPDYFGMCAHVSIFALSHYLRPREHFAAVTPAPA